MSLSEAWLAQAASGHQAVARVFERELSIAAMLGRFEPPAPIEVSRLRFLAAAHGPLLLGKTRYLGGGLFQPAQGRAAHVESRMSSQRA